MNRALGHFCVHKGQIGPGEPSENGEMSEMRNKHFCFSQTTETGKRNSNFSVKGSGAITTTLGLPPFIIKGAYKYNNNTPQPRTFLI